MKEPSDIEYARIVAALSPESTPEDRAWVEQWATEDSARRILIGQLEQTRQVLLMAGTADVVSRMQRIRDVVQAHVDTSERPVRPVRPVRPSRHGVDSLNGDHVVSGMVRAEARAEAGVEARVEARQARSWARLFSYKDGNGRPWGWFAIASVMFVCMMSVPQAIRWLHGNPSSFGNDVHAVRTVATRIGQQVQYRFADGSSVLLAPGTSIQYGADFGTNNRKIQLSGEALFTISPNERIPFVVETDDAAVRVLGTTFAVRRYAADTTTSIVVAQGRVAVAEKVLSSGEAAIVGRHGAVQIERGVDIRTSLGWTTGQLTYRRRPFGTIISDLERWYGLSVQVTNPTLMNAEVTATFLADSTDRALDVLAIVLQADIRRHGNNVTIHSQQRPD